MPGDAVDTILRQLRDPAGPDVIRVGKLPSASVAFWSARITDEVVITRTQRRHYLSSHPEMEWYETDLIKTLNDPDAVFRSLDDPKTALIYMRQDESHDIVAVVKVSTDAMLQNSVITARRQRAGKRGKPTLRNQLVWQREGEE